MSVFTTQLNGVDLKIVFGVMSAIHSNQVLDQLAGTLAPHEVIVHHDFEQQPDFNLRAGNTRLVPDPISTGWGVWGFTEGVFHLIRHCLKTSDFDYFQLLSPTCLPVKSLAQFEQDLIESQFDANIDVIELASNIDALMNYGMRAFTPNGSIRFRILKYCFKYYYGESWRPEQRANLQLRTGGSKSPSFAQFVCECLVRAAQKGYLGPSLLNRKLRPYVGGVWFGARREVCEYLLKQFDEPEIFAGFSKVYMAEEMMMATLLANSGFVLGPSNHLVNRFTEGNPNWLETSDMTMLEQTDRYFARKFPNSIEADVRLAVLNMIS